MSESPKAKPARKGVTYHPEHSGLEPMKPIGIPQKYMGHRKSSIPFNDRAPKVRFLRSVEPHGVNELGSHAPQPSAPDLKPILKKTEFPILVDMTQLDANGLRTEGCSTGCTNDALEGCTNLVEQIFLSFARAEREARGAVDILTFPVHTSVSVEALSRFEGSMVVAILAVDKLKAYTEDSSKHMVTEIVQLTDTLLSDLSRSQAVAKKLWGKAMFKYKQWGKLLNRKGEFRVEHARTKVPIYNKRAMPESVTLYEDVIEQEKRYGFDGSVRLFRTPNDIMLTTDTDLVRRYSEDVRAEVCSAIAQMLIDHVRELVNYAVVQCDNAIATLSQSVFDVGFESVMKKITNIEFDAFFDPLCALELKTALGDIAMRKEELVNTTEHIVTYFKDMRTFVRAFLKFCKQRPSGGDKDSKGCFFGFSFIRCGKPVSVPSLLASLKGLGNKEFMISIPLPESYETIIFNIPSSKDRLLAEEATSKPQSK